ncbi:UDP-N-acetylglucosamine transferase [compost metagenome]
MPFPAAVDDHQTTNARFLVDAGAAWLVPQTELTAHSLAQTLQTVQREQLMAMAIKAKQMEKTQAVAAVVSACEQLAKVQNT